MIDTISQVMETLGQVFLVVMLCISFPFFVVFVAKFAYAVVFVEYHRWKFRKGGCPCPCHAYNQKGYKHKRLEINRSDNVSDN